MTQLDRSSFLGSAGTTIRTCAMPCPLFGGGMDTTTVRLGPLGNGYARRVRWYDVTAPTVVDGLTGEADVKLLALRPGLDPAPDALRRRRPDRPNLPMPRDAMPSRIHTTEVRVTRPDRVD